MKIMWLCNTLIESVAADINFGAQKPESWITATYNGIRSRDNFSLFYLFPFKQNGNLEFKRGNFYFASYVQKNDFSYEKKQEKRFETLIKIFHPDVIHIFGTECPHTLAMLKVCCRLGIEDRVVVSIQGLVSKCLGTACLPTKAILRFTFRDFLRLDNVYLRIRKLKKRGKYEKRSIELSKNIVGRTDWDYACTNEINNNSTYYCCNETLRNSFYMSKWSLNTCETNSIFVSQSNYHIKGFHLMLEAMPSILKEYPNAHLYTTGIDPLKMSFKQKIRQSYYNRYLGHLIKRFHLRNKVTFLGYLNEKEMCDRLLQSHVFVSCSSIENSPNSLGEAMLLGVPSVASDVGGVNSMMSHGIEGFLYPADEPYMISHYIKRIFANPSIANTLSANSRKRAEITHNQDKNLKRIIEIYELVSRG